MSKFLSDLTMRLAHKTILLLPATYLVAMILPTTTYAQLSSQDFSECSQNFLDQTSPQFINSDSLNTKHQLTKQTYPLCLHGFAVLYSGISQTPLWSAEHLTKQRITQAKTLKRKNSFHQSRHIPEDINAQLKYYSKSGYDRGHLAPNSDMANHKQQYDSFSLVNITPQSPYLNRKIWKEIESTTRYLTKVYDETYIITGVVFASSNKNIKEENNNLHDKILIPTHVYKAVYIPKLQKVGVYFAPNDESGRIEVISVAELAKITTIDVMPNLNRSIKNSIINLPLPMKEINLANDSDAITKGLINTTTEQLLNSQPPADDQQQKGIKWLKQWLVGMIKWFRNQIKQ